MLWRMKLAIYYFSCIFIFRQNYLNFSSKNVNYDVLDNSPKSQSFQKSILSYIDLKKYFLPLKFRSKVLTGSITNRRLLVYYKNFSCKPSHAVFFQLSL